MRGAKALMAMIALSLFVSLLSGLNQAAGFFANVSLPTAIMSLALALTVLLAFPPLLKHKWRKEKLPVGSPRMVCILASVLICVFGTVPFFAKLGLALRSKGKGVWHFDRHNYAPARAHLQLAARRLESLGLKKQALRARIPLAWTLAFEGDWKGAVALVARIEDSPHLSPALRGKVLVLKAILANRKGDFVGARRHYQLAHQLVEKGSRDQAVLLQNEGALLATMGASYRRRASENFAKAGEVYEKIGDRVGLIHLAIAEGTMHENDPIEARRRYQAALEGALDAGDPYLVGTVRLNTGYTYRQQGKLDEARTCYSEARSSFERAADILGQAEVAINMASLDSARGRNELARQNLKAAEELLRGIHPGNPGVRPRALARIRTHQADIHDAFGETETARSLYQGALDIYAKHPDPLKEARTLLNFGAFLHRLGKREEARRLYARCREIIQGTGGQTPPVLLGVLLNNMGEIDKDEGNPDAACKKYLAASRVFKAHEDRMGYAQARENVALLRVGLTGADPTDEFKLALETYRAIGNRDHELKTLYNLYCFYTSTRNPSAGDTLRDIMSLVLLIPAYSMEHLMSPSGVPSDG